MPTLNLKVAPLQNPERYQALAAALTSLTADILGKRPEVTAVIIDDLPRARWSVGGSAVQGATAQLEIAITAGTNTEAEKARFIEAAYRELQRQLAPDGDFEMASYVAVRELPATDWGFGGQTQRARQLVPHIARAAESTRPLAGGRVAQAKFREAAQAMGIGQRQIQQHQADRLAVLLIERQRLGGIHAPAIEHLYRDPHDPEARLFLHYGDLVDGTGAPGGFNYF